MKISALKVDAAKIEAGEWVGDIPEMGDLELRVRGVDNADYRRRQAALFKALPRGKRRDGSIDIEDADRITSTLLFETVLLDWRGLEDDDGKSLAYNNALARALLFEPENRRFRSAVIYAATIVGEAAAEDLEKDTKN